MKTFDKPLITISKEEYDQLVECREVIQGIWQEIGPYKPNKFSCILATRIRELQNFDDDE